MQATSRAAMPNLAQARNSDLRSAPSRAPTTASSAKAAAQHQAEREAAMHVGPQQHGQQQHRLGRAALLDGADQARHPQQDQREGEHVRARQEVRRRHDDGGHGEERGRQRLQVAQQQAQQQREGDADGRGTERRHGAPAAIVEGERQQELRQPLLGDPGLAREGEGEAVDRGHGAVRQDPVADRDVPVAVGIAQQRQAAGVDQVDEQREAERQRPGKRPGRARPLQGGALMRIAGTRRGRK